MLTSCSIFKKSSTDNSTPDYGSHIPKDDDLEKQDTIIEEIVISEEEEEDKGPKRWDDGKEDILVVLPFNSYAHTMDGSHSFVLHFYSGLKRGFQMPQMGHRRSISLRVRDSRGYNSEMRSILAGVDSINTDLIIGGFSKNNIQSLSNLSKELEIPYLSPIFPSGSMNKENPYHIQVTPDFDSHCERLLQHIYKHHRNAKLQIISRNTSAENNRVRKLQEMWTKMYPDSEGFGVGEEIGINWEDENSEFNFLGKFDRYSSNIFIIPSWSSESFVYSVMRQLSIDKGRSEVIVYGMPQWRSFELSSYEYYEDLNLRISSGVNIDNEKNLDEIKKSLYKEFNYISSDKELLAYATGYDIGKYMAYLISQYGENWMDYLEMEKYKGMAVNFDFGRANEDKVLVSTPGSLGAYENESVRILEFQNYSFQLIEE